MADVDPGEMVAELRARHRQQSVISALSQAAIGAPDLMSLMNDAAAAIAESLDVEYSAVLQLLPEGAQLILRAGVGWREGAVGEATVPAGQGSAAGFALSCDVPVVVPDVRRETRFTTSPLVLEHGILSTMSVIVRGRARPWGTLSVHATHPRSFGPDDVDFLQSVANVLALAIERHEVEIAQRRENEVLQALFDNIPVMISFYDASHRLVRANREWERVLGWTVEEAQRIDLMAELYPNPQHLQEVRDFMRRSDRRWSDFRARTRDGRPLDASWLRFPLSDGVTFGFGVDITERKRAEEERMRLLESESRARAEAEAALERLHAIQAISDGALVHLSLDPMLRELLGRLRRALHADAASVQLLDDDMKTLYIRAVDGYSQERVGSIRVRLGTGLSGRIAAEGAALIVDDLSTLDLSGIEGTPPSEIHAMSRSAMGAPLRIGEKVVGVVSVNSQQPRRFTEDELQLLLLVADRVAPAIERSRLIESVQAGEERQKALARRLMTAQEEERRRLAVELHDELGQVLTAVKIGLESLGRLSGTAPAPGQLETMVEGVDQAMERVRGLALDLRPSVLDDLGLPAALRWYMDRFTRDGPIRAHLSIGAVPELDPSLQIACFRVAQEALTNVARHAQARQVWLDLHLLTEGLELRVRDDGIGFDTQVARERASGGASMGLLGMEERVSLAGGHYELTSQPHRGTEVRARFPMGERVRGTA